MAVGQPRTMNGVTAIDRTNEIATKGVSSETALVEKTNETASGESKTALVESRKTTEDAQGECRKTTEKTTENAQDECRNKIAPVDCRRIFVECARDLWPVTTTMARGKTRKRTYTIQ